MWVPTFIRREYTPSILQLRLIRTYVSILQISQTDRQNLAVGLKTCFLGGFKLAFTGESVVDCAFQCFKTCFHEGKYRGQHGSNMKMKSLLDIWDNKDSVAAKWSVPQWFHIAARLIQWKHDYRTITILHHLAQPENKSISNVAKP